MKADEIGRIGKVNRGEFINAEYIVKTDQTGFSLTAV